MTPTIRVGHVISGDLWAGAEVATFHLLCALQRRGDVALRVVCLNEGELARRLRAVEIETQVLPESSLSMGALLSGTRRLVAGLDLVHAHREKENLLAAGTRLPWISTRHGRPEPRTGSARIKSSIVSLLDTLARRFDGRRTLCVSQEVFDWCVPRVGRRRCVRIWNGIDDPCAEWTPTPWAERPRVVGVLGRLFPVKAFDLAIEVVAETTDLTLEVVGDGPERSALEHRARALGVAERVHFVGHDPAPLARVGRWRAMLVTSLHEGNPIGVIEALAVGTPVFSAPLGGVAEVMEGRGGWIQQDRDPKAWAPPLQRAVEDVPAGLRVSAAARARYESAFTSEACAAAVRAVYEEVLREMGDREARAPR